MTTSEAFVFPDTPDRPAKGSSAPRVLLIEDEALVRMVVAEGLEDLGFKVEEADSVAGGYEKLRLGEPFAAVVVDIGLADGRGDDLAEALCLSHPGLPIVVASGHGEREMRRRFAAHRQVDVLPKPYDSSRLGLVLKGLGLKPVRG